MADSSDDCFTDLHEEERVLPTKQITSRINGSYTQVAQNLTNTSQQASHKQLNFKCNLGVVPKRSKDYHAINTHTKLNNNIQPHNYN